MPQLANASDCACRSNRKWVHADHLQPGEAVWLPNGTWITFEWTDAAEDAAESITFVPDNGDEVGVAADQWLRRK